MADENTIFVVSGCERLLRNPKNTRFELSDPDFEDDAWASRSAASVHGDDGTPAPEYYAGEYSLAITTAHHPVNPSLGFVFGRNADCDIVLDDKAISDKQFAVRILWGTGTVVLKNHSKHGTRVNLHFFNEVVLLRDKRVFLDQHTADVHLGSGIQLHIRRLDRPANWAEYCAEIFNELLGIGRLQLEPDAESTDVSRRRPVYIVGSRLGSGAHAQVFEAVEKYTGTLYAVKLYNKTRRARWQEPEILEKLKHTNIVRYISYQRPAGHLAELVMEFIHGDTLQALLDPTNGYPPLTNYEARDVLYQLTTALCYLHGEGITHRDLKPANIMVPQRDPVHVKLVDFGEATALKEFATHCGTPLYVAPEITARRTCTNKVDMFSLGIIALQMLYGLPGNDRGQRATAALWLEAVRDRTTFLTTQGPPSPPLHLVCCLLYEDPGVRLSARQSLRHAFFVSGVNLGPVAALTTDSSQTGDAPTSIFYPLVPSVPAVPTSDADIPDTEIWGSVYTSGRHQSHAPGAAVEAAGAAEAADAADAVDAGGGLPAAAALDQGQKKHTPRKRKEVELARGYSMLECQGRSAVYRPRDKSINVTRLLREFGVTRSDMHRYFRRHPEARKAHTKTNGGAASGTYMVAGDDVLQLCQHFGLDAAVVGAICTAVCAAAEGRASSSVPDA